MKKNGTIMASIPVIVMVIYVIYFDIKMMEGKDNYNAHTIIQKNETLTNTSDNSNTIPNFQEDEKEDHDDAHDNIFNLKLEESKLYTTSWLSPIVLKEYKLLWFLNPKTGSTSQKYLLSKMLHPELPIPTVANPVSLDFPRLSDFSIDEASNMLFSDNWTRVITLRGPKERLLSAYLGKELKYQNFVPRSKKRDTFRYRCCKEEYIIALGKIINGENCLKHNFTFDEFIHATKICPDAHWDPQLERVDNHIELINFVIDFNHMAEDTETLLKKLGKDVWLNIGATGWGTNGSCAVFRENEHNHMDSEGKYYTPELEKIVEERYSGDNAVLRKYVT